MRLSLRVILGAMGFALASLSAHAEGSVSSLMGGTSPEMLVEEHILAEGYLSVPPDANLSIEFNTPAPDTARYIDGFNIDHNSGRFAVRLSMPEGELVVLRGRAEATVPVYLPARRFSAGEIITDSDIVLTEVPAKSLSSQILRSQKDIVGKETRRALSPHRPIPASSLIMPRVILRGDELRITYENGGLDLTAPGRALEDGAMGSQIRVVNLQSSKTITARVAGEGLAIVHPFSISTPGN